MLKKWCTPVAVSYFADDETEEPDDLVLWRDELGEKQSVVNEALTVRQKQELQALFDKYAGTLQSTPGRMSLAEHRIDVGQSPAVRQPPYHLPHAYRDVVKEELQEMERSGVIEPSTSEWASPVVLVKKKD